MYRQIPHQADEAFEIIFKDLNELFEDLIDIIKSGAEFSEIDGTKEEVYNLKGDLEDIIFDFANEMIYSVESGWIPEDVRVEGDEISVFFRRAKVSKFDYKALTYHMLKVEDIGEKKRVKVVFDV